MTEKMTMFQRVIIVANPKNERAKKTARQIMDHLRERGKEVIFGKIEDHDIQNDLEEGDYDVLIALGGDGTMLRAGHFSAPRQIPILGINLGRYGFLTETQDDAWEEALLQVEQGEYWLEHRMMLDTKHRREDQHLGTWSALNDVVISRGEVIRPIHLEIAINDRHLSSYMADAFIASTATGSTAYALAAGGPILSPELRNIILVPVAPHLSIEQPLVLDEGVKITVSPYTDHQAVVSIDGQDGIPLQNGDIIEITAGDHGVQFIRFQDRGYFYRNLIPYMDRNPAIAKKHDRKNQ